jgi:N-carbamoylputrescine amidase
MALTVAAIQMPCGDDIETNVGRAEHLVRQAAREGATLILLPELFEGPYFCIDQRPEHFALARPADGHPTIERFRAVATELGVALPISFFERAGQAHYNSIAMIDTDGTVLGIYRKTHIPDGPGYTEKYYFNPGDTGIHPWSTHIGRAGVGICWDQWFPETARTLALEGAEVLLFPTAIGSEPPDPSWDSSGHWQRVMQGHAAANLMPLVAANRVGTERGERFSITFYGSSFIADATGAKVAEAGREGEAVLLATFDLDELRAMRASWGLFRDRRPHMYGAIATSDGHTR